MTIRSYSNLATHFQNMAQNSRLRGALEKLNGEIATGQKADLQKSLGVNRPRLAHLDQTLHVIDAGLQTTTLYGARLEQQQNVLNTLDTRRQLVQNTSIGLSIAPSESELKLATAQGESAFADMVAALNESFGGRALFSGQNSDRPPLPSADSMLADLRTTINFAQAPADVIADIRSYFEDPTGAYATTHYQGGDAAGTEVRLNETTTSSPTMTAMDPGIRVALAAAAAVAVTADAPLPINDRAALVRETQNLALQSAKLATHRGILGVEQQRVSTVSAELTGRQAALKIERNNLTSADLYEAAGELQAVQAQLEAHFTIISRQSRLSLLEYM